MSKYDVIIVGAGFSGLTAGALLAKGGKKVLILEKNKDVGGFMRSLKPYPGYCFDYGIHGVFLGQKSPFADVYGRLGIPQPEIIPGLVSMDKVWTCHNGQLKKLADMFNPAEMGRVIAIIGQTSDEELKELWDVSLKDWTLKKTKDPGIHYAFQNLGPILCIISRWEDCSAGEFICGVRESLRRFPGDAFHVGAVAGGYQNLLPPLVKAFEENGGEIRTDTMVSEAIIENGKVKGVEIEKGYKVDKGYVSLGVAQIKSSTVLCAIPLWDLFRVVRESMVPHWYVAWVKRVCENLDQLYTVYAGLKEPLWEPTESVFAMPTLPRTASTQGAFYGAHWNVFDPSVAPKGEYLFIAMLQDDSLQFPYLKEPEKAENRRRIIEVFEKMEADIEDLWPKFKKASWVMRHASPLNISGQPGYGAAKHLPDVQVPGVKGLYLAGDKLRAQDGWEVASAIAVNTALKCADMILKGA